MPCMISPDSPHASNSQSRSKSRWLLRTYTVIVFPSIAPCTVHTLFSSLSPPVCFLFTTTKHQNIRRTPTRRHSCLDPARSEHRETLKQLFHNAIFSNHKPDITNGGCCKTKVRPCRTLTTWRSYSTPQQQ